MMLKYTDVKIRCYDACKIVRAVPIGGTAFAVHKVKGTWQITHVPSGKRVCSGRTYGHCKTIATILARIDVDWQDPELCKRPGFNSAQVLRVLAFLGGTRG